MINDVVTIDILKKRDYVVVVMVMIMFLAKVEITVQKGWYCYEVDEKF